MRLRSLLLLALCASSLAACDGERQKDPPVPVKVGAACAQSSDCDRNGGFCETSSGGIYEQGYCSVLGCTPTSCPTGTHCAFLQLRPEDGVCARDCSLDSDCRASGYRCFDADGDGRKECEAAGTGTAKVGAACNAEWECEGGRKARCLLESEGFYKNGFCTVTGCAGDAECPEDSHCGLLSPTTGFGECQATCTDDAACREGYACLDVDADGRSECLPSASGPGAIGDACIGLWECGTGAGGACLTQSTGVFRSGYCTARCDRNTPCPQGTTCLATSQTSGICMRTCASNDECRADGYRCTDANSDGSKECFPAGTGTKNPGEACQGWWECAGAIKGRCEPASNGIAKDGTCYLTGCKVDGDCPAGTHCAGPANAKQCDPDCAEQADCRSGYTCTDRDGDDKDECVAGGGGGTRPIGAPCDAHWDCAGTGHAFCAFDRLGYPGGYCYEAGCEKQEDCPADTHCGKVFANTPNEALACIEDCATDDDCRLAYKCVDLEKDGKLECVPKSVDVD